MCDATIKAFAALTGGPAKPAGPGGPVSPRSPCHKNEIVFVLMCVSGLASTIMLSDFSKHLKTDIFNTNGFEDQNVPEMSYQDVP